MLHCLRDSAACIFYRRFIDLDFHSLNPLCVGFHIGQGRFYPAGKINMDNYSNMHYSSLHFSMTTPKVFIIKGCYTVYRFQILKEKGILCASWAF